eukprot:1623372-Pleurochrysis_carterae.AAC.1
MFEDLVRKSARAHRSADQSLLAHKQMSANAATCKRLCCARACTYALPCTRTSYAFLVRVPRTRTSYAYLVR